MLCAADEGFTVATAVANRLVAQGVPFRAAHRVVGRLVTELIADGVRTPSEVDIESTGLRLAELLRSEEVTTRVVLTGADLDPNAVLTATDFGGGPGPTSFAAAHDRLAAAWRDHARAAAARSDRLLAAEAERNEAVRRWGGDT
jgi:argininosuccinate lyase